MQAAIGILAALMAREKTGRGQYVDIAMTDGVVSLMAQPLAEFFASGRVPERGNERITGGWPNYNVYETKDRKYISIGCLEPWFFENICRALGREDLIPYQNTAEKWGEIFAAFREIFRTKTRDEWFDLLKEQDVCVAKVYELDELERDPQLVHRNMIVEVDTPALGKVKQAGISIKLSETPGRIRSVAPLRGQHTEEILLTLGYSKEQIEGIQGEGATA
jgi:crotonobetainyl-CoA:carnitine CoA-transferase CaiB-like acyl-CoA transferase